MEKTMSKMNLIVHINAYEDDTDTNSPTMNNVKWNRELNSIDIAEPESKSLKLNAGQSMTLFSGTVSTSDDNSTTFDLALKVGCTNVYRISHNSGTTPAYRQARLSGADATTVVTVTKNAKLITMTSSAGTAFDLIANGVVVGDEVRVGAPFNTQNQGKFKILALTATSFTFEHEIGQAEGPITLGATFANAVDIYSADGVQIGDKTDIVAGFSSVVFGTYEIVDVSHGYIEIYSNESLPSETAIGNVPEVMLIYRDAKQFLYIESDNKINIKLNGSVVTNEIQPFQVGTAKKSGVFMTKASVKSCIIENKSQQTASIFYVSAE